MCNLEHNPTNICPDILIGPETLIGVDLILGDEEVGGGALIDGKLEVVQVVEVGFQVVGVARVDDGVDEVVVEAEGLVRVQESLDIGGGDTWAGEIGGGFAL